MAYMYYNPNPNGISVGDCAVRAMSKALDEDWDKAYLELCAEGFLCCDMPTANKVWGAILKKKGYTRKGLTNECPECYSVKDFCRTHDRGTYVLALDGHVVTICDGDYYDSWDSGNGTVLYYWQKGE